MSVEKVPWPPLEKVATAVPKVPQLDVFPAVMRELAPSTISVPAAELPRLMPLVLSIRPALAMRSVAPLAREKAPVKLPTPASKASVLPAATSIVPPE